jgi:hypothetical protein
MNFKRICILLILFLFSISAFSQVDSTFRDTIQEITIFEYDTVYMQPDTIRLTDTIVDIIKLPSIKKKNHTSLNFKSFFSALSPNTFGINFFTFVAGNLQEKKISDSLFSQPIINECYSFRINYNFKKYLFSIGAGFIPYREKYHFLRTYNVSNFKANPSVTYDSLLITKEYTSNFYYNYLNFNVLFGRKWNLNKKWYINLNGICITDFLFGYKQGKTDNPEPNIRKFDISIGFSPYFIYKFNNKLEIYFSPFYQHSLLNDKKYPFTSFQKMGIGVGFNIISKKS